MFNTTNIKYIGVNDHKIDLFEGQYPVPEGMAYNSYLILDEKIAVVDSVEASFSDQWLGNIRSILGDRSPDYLIVQHMEPDHSGSIRTFMDAFPLTKIVASSMAFNMMQNFFGTDFCDRQIVVGDKDSLSLGTRTLLFTTAPMVHWPEVIMTYDDKDKILFSADAFGKFGALTDSSTEADKENWTCEARKYYFGIVGKYGAQVQTLLGKLSGLDIKCICPLHGPQLTENLSYYLNLYDTWSSYKAEEEGITIAYTSVYGNTKKAVELLADTLRRKGCQNVTIYDLARCDMFEAVEDAFRYDKLILATTTYNGEIFPFMAHFIHHLVERNYSNRKVAFMENGSWAPVAARTMKEMLACSEKITYSSTVVRIKSAIDEENISQIETLAEELLIDDPAETPEVIIDEPKKKQFVCKVCGYVYEGEELPEGFTCPLCKRSAEDFEEREM